MAHKPPETDSPHKYDQLMDACQAHWYGFPELAWKYLCELASKLELPDDEVEIRSARELNDDFAEATEKREEKEAAAREAERERLLKNYDEHQKGSGKKGDPTCVEYYIG